MTTRGFDGEGADVEGVATALAVAVLTGCPLTGVTPDEPVMAETEFVIDAAAVLGEEAGQIVVVTPFITVTIVDSVEPGNSEVVDDDVTAEEVLLLLLEEEELEDNTQPGIFVNETCVPPPPGAPTDPSLVSKISSQPYVILYNCVTMVSGSINSNLDV